MDRKHCDELTALSRDICSQAADRITGFCAARYCAVGNDTMEQQLEDFLFVAEQSSAFLLGNALALLDADTQEAEIRLFTENLRRVIRKARQEAGE